MIDLKSFLQTFGLEYVQNGLLPFNIKQPMLIHHAFLKNVSVHLTNRFGARIEAAHFSIRFCYLYLLTHISVT